MNRTESLTRSYFVSQELNALFRAIHAYHIHTIFLLYTQKLEQRQPGEPVKGTRVGGGCCTGILPHQEVDHLGRVTFWQEELLDLTAQQDCMFLQMFFSQDTRFPLTSGFVAG